MKRGNCDCRFSGLHWPRHILAKTASESITRRSERPYIGTSLEGCEKVWGLTGCRYKPTVDKGLWGMGKSCSCYGDLVARLNFVCSDGAKCDICNIGKPVINVSPLSEPSFLIEKDHQFGYRCD